MLNLPVADATNKSRPEVSVPSGNKPGAVSGRLKTFAGLCIVLAIFFARPLYDLIRFAIHSELFSHVLLVPFISIYLVKLKRRELPADSRPVRLLALAPMILGLALVAGYWLAIRSGWRPATEDYLATMTLSFVALVWSACFLCFGTSTLVQLSFPLAFLIFMVPFPVVLWKWAESFLQHGSADAAYLLFKLTGMPVFRDGTMFQLPGFSMEVAPQCSGIHSSLVLVITSLLAAHLLLKRAWARSVLVLAVIPLGMLRNGFRICVLGHLCVKLNPDWINSELHHRGGPIFFVISLLPLFLLLFALRRLEMGRRK